MLRCDEALQKSLVCPSAASYSDGYEIGAGEERQRSSFTQSSSLPKIRRHRQHISTTSQLRQFASYRYGTNIHCLAYPRTRAARPRAVMARALTGIHPSSIIKPFNLLAASGVLLNRGRSKKSKTASVVILSTPSRPLLLLRVRRTGSHGSDGLRVLERLARSSSRNEGKEVLRSGSATRLSGGAFCVTGRGRCSGRYRQGPAVASAETELLTRAYPPQINCGNERLRSCRAYRYRKEDVG